MQAKYTPLHYAAALGHSQSVQLLLAADGNPNAETDVSAALCNVMELCGAELCGLDWQDKSTPLHKAAWKGDSESVQLLLVAKGNVNAENMVMTPSCKYDGAVWS